MSLSARLSRFPARLAVGMHEPRVWYLRQPGLFAVHDAESGATRADALLVLNDGAIAVFKEDVDAAARVGPNAILTPVYSVASAGRLAVPTGLIFLRLRADAHAQDYRERIAKAGYRIDSIPSYAPQSAWLRSQSGDICDSLQNIATLEALPDVENVEPQMLMEAARRDVR